MIDLFYLNNEKSKIILIIFKTVSLKKTNIGTELLDI